jgi:hypothetical protein
MKRRAQKRTGVFALSAILLFSTAAASTAGAANPANSSKPYSIVICAKGQVVEPGDLPACTPNNPAVVAPGGTSTYTVTLTNKNKLGTGLQLGSDNLNVPATPSGFSVISTSLQACPIPLSQQGATCVYLYDSSGNIVSSGGVTVGFRNLNLPPGGTITVTLAVTTPPLTTPGCTTAVPCLWSDEAKQSNDFSGTGNDLNADSTSAYGTVTNSTSSCPKRQGCSTALADGGTATGGPGSVNVVVTTLSGKTAVTQVQALDFGPAPDPTLCQGQLGPVTATHFTYWDMFNGADNGADRSQQISITTTTFGLPTSGPGEFQQELCFVSEQQFMMKTFDTSLNKYVLAPANPTTFPGTKDPAFEGLLPDCSTNLLASPPTVDCNKLPGVLERVPNDGKTATTVAVIAPGFDRGIGYN